MKVMYRVILKCHKQYAMNDTSISSKFYSFGIHMKLLRNPYERERLFRMNLIWISHEYSWDSYALDMKPIFHKNVLWTSTFTRISIEIYMKFTWTADAQDENTHEVDM